MDHSAVATEWRDTTSQEGTRFSRLRELDGIRGLAILLVLAFHYVGLPKGGDPGTMFAYCQALLGLGWTGVDLFFALSGFLIGGILLDAKYSPRYFSTFYVRRVFRILPLFFLSVAVFGILGSTGFDKVFPRILFENAIPVWAYLLFIQNFWMAVAANFGPHWLGITWSLAIEEQFYLILPPLIRFLRRKVLFTAIGVGVLLAPIVRVFITHRYSPSGHAVYVLMPCRFDALGLGVLAAILIRGRTPSLLIRKYRLVLYTLGAALSGLMVVLLRYRSPSSKEMTTWGYSAIALFYVTFLIIAVTYREGSVARITRASVLGWLGRHSYCIYLIHHAVNFSLHFWLRLAPPAINTAGGILVTMLSLIITMSIAWLSWSYFEKNLVALGQRFAY